MHEMKTSEVFAFRDNIFSSYTPLKIEGTSRLIHHPPSQLLVCRSEPSVGEKKEDYNVDDRATATATEERGVDLLDLVGNAEMATMMDELKTVLEMEKAKCRGL